VAMTQKVKRGLVAAGVVALLGAVPFVAGAQGERGPMHGGRGFMGGIAGLRQLGLTDDQRQQIRAAASAHRDEFKSVFERVRTARQAQQAAIEQVPLNEPQIRAASAELAAAEADAAVLRARVHEQVFSLLTPEQQTKAKSLAAERRQFRAQRRAEWQQRMEQFKQQQPSQAAPQQ
jgi:Spy/CpxP family protein refolding chaperone